MADPSSRSGSPLLSVRNVSVRFGGIVALDGVTFDVFPGQIAGLIGPNGAGKTTLFNCLSRLYTPNGGDILFEDKSILRRPRHDIPTIGDRKSTRLNSSHQIISYAVFCLKKK